MSRIYKSQSSLMRIFALIMAVSGLASVHFFDSVSASRNTLNPTFQSQPLTRPGTSSSILGDLATQNFGSNKLVVSPMAVQHISTVSTCQFVWATTVIPSTNHFTNRVYSVNTGSTTGSVSVIDGNTNTLLSVVPLGSESYPVDIISNGDAANPKVYVTGGSGGVAKIFIIDCLTNQLVRTVNFPGYIFYGFVSGTGTGTYVVGYERVYRLNIPPQPGNPDNGTIEDTLPRSPIPYPADLREAKWGTMYQGKIYLSTRVFGQGKIVVIDADGVMRKEGINVGIGSYRPGKPVVVPETQKMYVGTEEGTDNRIHIINLVTDTVLNSISFGGGPAVGADTSAGVNKVYVISHDTNQLWTLRSSDDMIISGPHSIPTVNNPLCPTLSSGPREIAVNPASKSVYVANTNNLSMAIFRDAPHTVTQFYPCASTTGKTITIYGSGFVDGYTQVYFGSGRLIPATSVIVVNSTTLEVVVPPSSSGVGNINGYLTIRVNGLDVTTQNLPQSAPDPGNSTAVFPEFVLWGDATGDGMFQSNDVTLCRAFSLFQVTPTPRQLLSVDVTPANPNNCSRGNGGNISSADFVLVRAVSLFQADFACTGFPDGTCGCEMIK